MWKISIPVYPSLHYAHFRAKSYFYVAATLPHEKYYHMEAYERRMSALRQGEFVPPPDDSYDPQADMKAISGAHKKKVVEHESYLSKDQLQALRKVQHERIEVCPISFFVVFDEC